jgi:hypothetical protein
MTNITEANVRVARVRQGISRITLRPNARIVSAFAILGTSPVDRVIAHGLLGLPLPACPSRYFTDEDAALDWLQHNSE